MGERPGTVVILGAGYGRRLSARLTLVKAITPTSFNIQRDHEIVTMSSQPPCRILTVSSTATQAKQLASSMYTHSDPQ
jgi:hypothetical protein